VPAFGSVNDQVEDPHPHSATEGSEPTERKDIDGEELEQVYPSPSTTSIPHDGKPDST